MARSPREVARRIAEPYEGDAERPLRGYTLVLGTYGALVAAMLPAVAASDRLQLGYDATKQAPQKLS